MSPEEIVEGYRESGLKPVSWKLFEREGGFPEEAIGACAMGAFVYNHFGYVPNPFESFSFLEEFDESYKAALSITFNYCVDLGFEVSIEEVPRLRLFRQNDGISEGYEDAVGAWRLLQEKLEEGVDEEVRELAVA